MMMLCLSLCVVAAVDDDDGDIYNLSKFWKKKSFKKIFSIITVTDQNILYRENRQIF